MLAFCCYCFIMAMQIKFLMTFVLSILIANQKSANRSLIIFADKNDNQNVVRQINMLKADAKGVTERNIIYRVIIYSAVTMQQYKNWGVTKGPFTVILIGKDGGEKLRSHQPVSLTKLFDVIDNMPMRQQEIHDKN